MNLGNRGARLRPQDVQELNQASEEMAAAAEIVKRTNPSWGAAVIQLLISANNRVVAIQNRGAATFARYLEKHGIQEPQDGSDASIPGEPTSDGQNEPSEGSGGL